MITDLIQARQMVETRKSWLVVVVPDDQIQSCLRIVASFTEGFFSGRTLLLAGGGKMSVAAVTDANFVPAETPFSVLFLGWGGKYDGSKMQPWREAASQVIPHP